MQFVSINTLHDQSVLVEDMFAPGGPVRGGDSGVGSEGIVIVISHLPPGIDVFVEVFQLYVEHGGLDRIEPAVASHHVMVVALALAVVGHHLHLGGQLVVIGHDGTAIAVAAEVF